VSREIGVNGRTDSRTDNRRTCCIYLLYYLQLS